MPKPIPPVVLEFVSSEGGLMCKCPGGTHIRLDDRAEAELMHFFYMRDKFRPNETVYPRSITVTGHA